MSWATEVAADSPLAWWKRDEASGNATDSSGNSHPATVHGSPTYSATALYSALGGNAIQVTADTQWWDCADAAVAGLSGAWSLEAIVNLDSGLSRTGLIVAGYDGSHVGFGLGLGLSDDGNHLEAGFYNGGWSTARDPNAYTSGVRKHVVGTYDGTTIRLYVNGVLIASQAAGSNVASSGQPCYLDRCWDGGTPSAKGYHDDYVVYSTALSAARVAAHYAELTPDSILGGSSDLGITSTADLTFPVILAGSSDLGITSTAALSVPLTLEGWDDDSSQLSTLGIVSTASLTVRPTPVPVPPSLLNGGEKVYWQRDSQVWPTPTDDGDGYPDPDTWVPTSTTTGIVGRPQVVVFDLDGQPHDVTFYDDVAVQFGDMRHSEPFGYESLDLFFPQITTLGTTARSLGWTKRGRRVEVHILDENDDLVFENWFVGDVINLTRNHAVQGSGLAVSCEGILRGAGSIAWQPRFRVASRDIGHVIADGFNDAESRPWGWCDVVDTGINTRKRGSRDDTLLGFSADLLSTSTTADGEGQWTVSCPGTRPVVEEKDTTTVHWTVTNGGQGVESRLSGPVYNRVTSIFGQGIDTDGCAWANVKYPNWHPDDSLDYPWADTGTTMTVGTVDADTDSGTGVTDWQSRMDELGYAVTVTGTFTAKDANQAEIIQQAKGLTVDGIVGPQTWAATFGVGSNQGDLDGAFYAPLAWRYNVRQYLHEGDGSLTTENPDYDPTVPHVDRFIDFGEGVSKDEGIEAARAELKRAWLQDFSGTIVLTADPEEGSRRLIRSGQNILLKSWEPGSDTEDFRPEGDDVLFHISGVTVSPDGTVTLDVDTQFRDMLNLAEIHQRNRENNPHPGKRKGNRRRLSETVRQSPIWDCESKAGIMPRAAVLGGAWTVFRIPGGSSHPIVEAFFSTDSPHSEFVVAVAGAPITPSDLDRLVGDPFADPADGYYSVWEPNHSELKDTYNLRWSWGEGDEPGGYAPQHKTGKNGNGGTLTGDLIDDGGFPFRSDHPPWAWIAVYTADSCYFSGRLKAAPVDS